MTLLLSHAPHQSSYQFSLHFSSHYISDKCRYVVPAIFIFLSLPEPRFLCSFLFLRFSLRTKDLFSFIERHKNHRIALNYNASIQNFLAYQWSSNQFSCLTSYTTVQLSAGSVCQFLRIIYWIRMTKLEIRLGGLTWKCSSVNLSSLFPALIDFAFNC